MESGVNRISKRAVKGIVHFVVQELGVGRLLWIWEEKAEID